MGQPPDVVETRNRLLLKVLRSDSGLGITFAHLAAEAAAGSERRVRNQANARKAYDTVLSFSSKMTLSSGETREIAATLDELKSALEALGEHFV